MVQILEKTATSSGTELVVEPSFVQPVGVAGVEFHAVTETTIKSPFAIPVGVLMVTLVSSDALTACVRPRNEMDEPDDDGFSVRTNPTQLPPVDAVAVRDDIEVPANAIDKSPS